MRRRFASWELDRIRTKGAGPFIVRMQYSEANAAADGGWRRRIQSEEDE